MPASRSGCRSWPTPREAPAGSSVDSAGSASPGRWFSSPATPTSSSGSAWRRSQDLGVGHGGGETNRFIVDRQIDLNDPVQPGDAVLTSGLSNSVMPPDIPIGVVDKVTPDVDTQVKLLQVRFAVDFSQLDVVQVLKWKPAS